MSGCILATCSTVDNSDHFSYCCKMDVENSFQQLSTSQVIVSVFIFSPFLKQQ